MKMRHLPTFVIALLALHASPALAQDDPALAEAIRTYAAGVSLSPDPANLHVADFNGDGQPDVAVVLDSDGRSALVIFNRTARGYQAHPLYASLPASPWQLRVVEPGRHRILGPEGALELSSPAIELVFPGRSSAIYAWRGSRYQVFGTENYH